jgi:hypothetical protein
MILSFQRDEARKPGMLLFVAATVMVALLLGVFRDGGWRRLNAGAGAAIPATAAKTWR